MQIPQPAKTENWHFRSMEAADAQAIFEINNDAVTKQFTVLTRQSTLPDIQSWIENYPAYKRYGFGIWVIANKQNNAVLGLCGLRVRKDLNNSVDLSYRMHANYRNLGIATKAISLCVQFGFNELHLPHIMAQVHCKNVVSAHILQKMGFAKTEFNKPWQNWEKSNPS